VKAMAERPPIPVIEVFAIETIEELRAVLPHQRRFFTLFLAWDAHSSVQTAVDGLFRPLLDRGLAYFCAWGHGCEDVHDTVDECVVERELEVGEAGYTLMTTWHDKEPLEEALEFFSMCAIPSEDQLRGDFERFAVAVGNSGWAERMGLFLADPTSQ